MSKGKQKREDVESRFRPVQDLYLQVCRNSQESKVNSEW